jgi:predicted PhzF superfamily epimerase YddE/YHI9
MDGNGVKIKNGKDYDLRWFTPKIEIELCGHATLVAAFILRKHICQEAYCY